MTIQDKLISDMADEADFRPILEMFVNELPERMAAIYKGIESGDIGLAREKAHQLKGAGGGYGYMCITEAARDLEQACKDERPVSEIKPLADVLNAMCEAAKRGL